MERHWLKEIPIAAYRLAFTGAGPETSASLLRSAYGAALAVQSPEAFSLVFRGDDPSVRRPGFSLRREEGGDSSSVYWARWILIGEAALRQESLLCSAWGAAGAAGLGRARLPFHLDLAYTTRLGPDGAPLPAEAPLGWTLDGARWPLHPLAPDAPCRLVFSQGLHLSAKTASEQRRRFVTAPDWPRLTRSAWNRFRPWLSPVSRRQGDEQLPTWLSAASAQPSVGAWRLVKATRWSSTQGREIPFDAVQGCLELPEGPGRLWPLLSALYWLGVGHHTTEGLGGFSIEALAADGESQDHREKWAWRAPR